MSSSSAWLNGSNTPRALTSSATGQPSVTAYFDRLGREIRAETQGFDGTLVRKDTLFDALGRVSHVSLPYLATQAPVWTRFDYDLVGRVRLETDPGGATTATEYSGLTTTVTNALNQKVIRRRNAQGQLVQVIRP